MKNHYQTPSPILAFLSLLLLMREIFQDGFSQRNIVPILSLMTYASQIILFLSLPTALAESIDTENAMDILYPACPGPYGKGFLGSWKGADNGGTAQLEWRNESSHSVTGLCYVPHAFGLHFEVQIKVTEWPINVIMQAGEACGLNSTTLIPRETRYKTMGKAWQISSTDAQ